jgi:hypothetical protein
MAGIILIWLLFPKLIRYLFVGLFILPVVALLVLAIAVFVF